MTRLFKHPFFPLVALFLVIGITLFASSNQTNTRSKAAGSFGSSLQFFGNQANDIDRVKIPLTPNKSINVSGDFTLEWWMKTTSGNNSGTCQQGAMGVGDYDWISGNILFDRDIYNEAENGKYGVSLIGAEGGRISFGVATGNGMANICSNGTVADGQWHHVAVTRVSSGQICIFIDGSQSGCKNGPTGQINYLDGRSTSSPNSDPFFVIGAEKHDVVSAGTGYHGFLDEVRLSNSVRYTGGFSVPTQPFVTDGNTVALYHFGEGTSGTCTGAILDVTGINNGSCKPGGSPQGPVWSNDTPVGTGTNPQVTTPQLTSSPTSHYMTPVFNCLANICPTNALSITPSMSVGPTTSTVTGVPSPVNPTAGSGTQVPVTQAPCTNEGVLAARTSSKKSKHRHHNGGLSRLMAWLLNFCIELLNLILKMFGGQLPIPNPNNPPSTPNPTNPCPPTSAPSNAPQPTSGAIPTGTVPSIGQQPSTVPAPSGAAPAGTVTRNGKTLMMNGQPYKFIGFNSFGLEGCEGIWYTDADYDRYFSALKPYSMTRTGAFTYWGFEQLDKVVASAERNNQFLVLMLADGRSQCNEVDGAPGGDGSGKSLAWYQSGYKTNYIPWVKQVVQRYKNSKAIGMWELLNEPGFDAPDNVMRAFFDDASATIKSIDPNHLVESGTIAEYVDGTTDFAYVHGGPNMDVASVHEYDYDYNNSNVIESGHFEIALEAMNSINKPLIIGEVGVNGAPSGCRTNLEARSNVFKQKFDTYLSKGAAGVLIWNWSQGNYNADCSWWVGPNDPLMQMMRNYQIPN